MRARLLVPTLSLSFLLPVGAHSLCAQQEAPAAAAPAEDAGQDEHAMFRTVRTDLVADKFDEIDSLADQFRRDKSRWRGGNWKLHTLYEALDAPHLTDKDSVEHLDHIRAWVTARPESVTARITLATSLHRWAWVARGNGTADKVTPEGWQLFNQRIAEAQAVLDGSRDMKVTDPQWYSEEMVVGLAAGWDARRMRDLYERAVQFEPDWQYYYKARANYLLPKWYGEGTATADFAKSAADRLGGDRGDMMYFDMGTVILNRHNGNITPLLAAMDWPRLQRGYAVMNATFGDVGNGFKNEFAWMAYRYKDQAVAREQFALLGDRWAEGVWKDRVYYDRARDWSIGHTQWP